MRGGEEDSWGPGRGERVLVRGKYIWDLNKEEAAPNGHVLERVSATGGFDDGRRGWDKWGFQVCFPCPTCCPVAPRKERLNRWKEFGNFGFARYLGRAIRDFK